MLIHFRLVEAGYGTLAEVQTFGARVVLQALNYLKYCSEYERAYLELNK